MSEIEYSWNMKYVGAHVSASGGVWNAPENAKKIAATAFGLFTKNQRQWKAKPLSEEDVSRFREAMERCGYTPFQVLPHDSYLINRGNPDPEKREKSLDSFIHELGRVEELGLRMLNFHPGGHLKQASDEECLSLIGEAMNRAIYGTQSAVLVIESTAGQGSHLGYRFEHLAALIDMVENKERVGVCLDTCHLYAAGYDIRSKEAFTKTFEDFDRIVGFQWLRGMHLNDAKSELGSRVDRHHSLGEGEIGWDAFRYIMEDPRFDDIPMILETVDPDLWEEEIRTLKGFATKSG